MALLKLSEGPSQPRQVIVHVNRLQTLIQKSQHYGIHNLDVGIDDLRLLASLLDLDQLFSCFMGHFLKNVKEVNSLLNSNVDSKVGFTLSEQPLELRLRFLVVDELES